MISSTDVDMDEGEGYARFRALALPTKAPAAHEPVCDTLQREILRLTAVAKKFARHFGQQPIGIARAPGRVNLIGEHVDYEGYAVLPMAIEHSIYVAFGTSDAMGTSTGTRAGGTSVLNVANASPKYRPVTLAMWTQQQEEGELHVGDGDDKGAAWARYVLCGVLGVRDSRPELFSGESLELQLLVDGDIPAGCGLSSSSALVVAAALATTGALQPSLEHLPSRMGMAELCRRAEHRVGTMGGGMDQTIACLAQPGVALHLDFSTVPARCSRVHVADDSTGVTFIVANSLVVAEKAVDAATRFNKRVVECALAARVISKRLGVPDWKQVQSRVYCVCAQRALHVWGEAERVEQFRVACYTLESDEQTTPGEAAGLSLTQQQQVRNLGEIMLASHRSCQTLYECSCPELDALVDAAMGAGALGARLTGAGWGGCIVALIGKAEAASFMEKLQVSYYAAQGIPATSFSDVMFESPPSAGADLFVLP
ncbi:hypothetical protein BBJ28_00011837 [Nothophytophthora sp. Chile5]|nr:hypothetical protein BBJ28_00011837 [Nothophytophthora sp. Chile5]